MTNKGNGEAIIETPEQPALANELFQLRDILFGEDKREFEAHLDKLEQQTNQQIDGLTAYLNQEIAELKQTIENQFLHLTEQITDTSHLHAEREDELQELLDKTCHQLNAFEQSTGHVTSDILNKLTEQTTKLSNNLDKKHQHAMATVDKVSQQLQENKADKQVLASLLSAAAQHLESDKS